MKTMREHVSSTMELSWYHDNERSQSDFRDLLYGAFLGVEFEQPTKHHALYKAKDVACKDLEVLEIRGYNHVTWFKVPKNLVATDAAMSGVKDLLYNITYAAPITLRIEVDNEEFYLEDHLTDSYDSSKDAMLEAVKKWGEANPLYSARALALAGLADDYADYEG